MSKLKTAAETIAIETEPQTDRTDVRSRLEDLPSYLVGIHTRTEALRRLVSESEQRLVQSYLIASGAEDRHYGNAARQVYEFCESDYVQQYITRREVLALVERCDEFKEADAVIRPLLAELAEVEAKEQAIRVLQAERENAVRDALEIAKTRALEAAENDPAVVKARAKLEEVKA
jgi:hypothetical protein